MDSQDPPIDVCAANELIDSKSAGYLPGSRCSPWLIINAKVNKRALLGLAGILAIFAILLMGAWLLALLGNRADDGVEQAVDRVGWVAAALGFGLMSVGLFSVDFLQRRIANNSTNESDDER